MANINNGITQNAGYQKVLKKNIKAECKLFKAVYDETYAEIAERTITSAAYKIMRLYYTYKQKRYKRTYKLRDKSYTPYNDPRHHSGGVRINLDQTQPYYTKTIRHKDGTTDTIKRPASQIWGNSWREGFHGYPEQGIPYATPETLQFNNGKTPLLQQEYYCNRRRTQELVALETMEVVNKKVQFQYLRLKDGAIPFQKQVVHLPRPTKSSKEGEE